MRSSRTFQHLMLVSLALCLGAAHARPGHLGLSEPAHSGDRAGRRRRRPRHTPHGSLRRQSRSILANGSSSRTSPAQVSGSEPHWQRRHRQTATRCCSPRPRRSRWPSTSRRSLTTILSRDFRPVAIAVYQPVLLIVRPTLGVKTVAEFIAYAKSNPGKLSFGVQGLGGEMHLSLEHMKKLAAINITPVPYNAAAQAIVDLLADRLDAMFLVIPPIKGHVDNGRLLALATLNAKRVDQFPNVPTMAEAGLPEMTTALWFGYLAPAKVPQPIIDKLARALASFNPIPLWSSASLNSAQNSTLWGRRSSPKSSMTIAAISADRRREQFG